MHYLRLFCKMFDGFVEVFRSQCRDIGIFYSMNDGIGKGRAYDGDKLLLKECTNALGISIYVKSLLLSKYNRSFCEQHAVSSHTEEEDGCTICQKAKNLFFSIEYIRLIKIRSRNRINIINAELHHGKLQETIGTLSKLEDIHNKSTHQQEIMESSLKRLERLQERNEIITKRWHYISLIFAVASIIFAVVSLFR